MTARSGWNSTAFNAHHCIDDDCSYPKLHQLQDTISPFTRFSAMRNSRLAQRPLALHIQTSFNHLCSPADSNPHSCPHRSLYLHRLQDEIRTTAQHCNKQQPIRHLRFSATSATQLSTQELQELMQCLNDNFNMTSDNFSHYAIDINPSHTDWSTMGLLRAMGFNRVNIVVPDTHSSQPQLQSSLIQRSNTIEQIQHLVEAARTLQFRTIGIDLSYGLPQQTTAAFQRTLTEIIKLEPDRIHLHNTQRSAPEQGYSSAFSNTTYNTTIETMLYSAQQQLNQAHYSYLGMGHFAVADDDLSYAQEDGTLQHSIDGYSTSERCDIIGLGIAAVSQLGELFYQNTTDFNAYQNTEMQLAPARGLFCATNASLYTGKAL